MLLEDSGRTTVQLVVGERCTLAASSGSIKAAPDIGSKRFLATQTLDEARHIEIFRERLFDLGVKKHQFEDVLQRDAKPNLSKFSEMMRAANVDSNPKFAQVLSGSVADERRPVGFGEKHIGSLVEQYPEKKRELEKLQKDMRAPCSPTFSDAFRQNHRAVEEGKRLMEASAEDGAPPTQGWQGRSLANLEPQE